MEGMSLTMAEVQHGLAWVNSKINGDRSHDEGF